MNNMYKRHCMKVSLSSITILMPPCCYEAGIPRTKKDVMDWDILTNKNKRFQIHQTSEYLPTISNHIKPHS